MQEPGKCDQSVVVCRAWVRHTPQDKLARLSALPHHIGPDSARLPTISDCFISIPFPLLPPPPLLRSLLSSSLLPPPSSLLPLSSTHLVLITLHVLPEWSMAPDYWQSRGGWRGREERSCLSNWRLQYSVLPVTPKAWTRLHKTLF